MNKQKRWDIFNYWFEHHGHWMFGTDGKDKAIKVWQKDGIDGLPDFIG